MKQFQVAYIPIGVPTFHLESAQIEFDKSISMIKGLTDNGVFPDEMLLSMDKLDNFLNSIEPNLVIVQNITFANSAYITEVLKKFDCPVLLWTLREPIIDGGRLRLNSLTGAYSAGNTLMHFRNANFEYVFGSPDEEDVTSHIKATIEAARVKHVMRGIKVAAIGHTPQGFGFGRALDIEMAQVFGATLESLEARELIEKAKAYETDVTDELLEQYGKVACNHDVIDEKNMVDFARLLKAYKDFVDANNIKVIASRCWPDFFVSYGTPVCGVLSLLNDWGVSASCEADTYGALSMYIASQFTHKASFFGDPVSLDEEENTITYWHCGMAACSLSRDEKANTGVHPNRKIGPVMDFGCKADEQATVFRIGKDADGKFRFFIMEGSILDKPKQFQGTSIVVKPNGNCKDIITKSVKAGFEPHFVVAYGHIAKELEILANMLDLEVVKY
ncbi:MAG: fucose isomerase [Epulopiscium sp. Nele67-Bin002]|nr:MAG: fucose isomerase [Epulopiscium sp. Nele67-Bin002]OON92490.1 MAG: fucose isomerase [Epulopiscium sp. Nele67-Bin001]